MDIKDFCLIIGTQKGGTTSLFAYLAQHPEVSASRIKETNFFSEDTQWQKGLDYYTGLWEPLSSEHKIALEASPNYTNSLREAELVAKRTKSVDANFKFIYILRDPIEKISSMRVQGVYQGWYKSLLERETPDSVPPETIEPTRYAEIVDKFVREFSQAHVLLLQMDDLRASDRASEMMQRICNFLEIDPTFEFDLGKIHNAQNSYREDTLWHALRSSAYLSYLKGIFPDALKNKARSLLSKPLPNSANLKPANLKSANLKSANKEETMAPPLTDEQKRFILIALKDEFHQLEQRHGLDLSEWLQLPHSDL